MTFVKGEVRRFNTGVVQSGNGCFSMHCPHWHPSQPVPVIIEREWDGEKWIDLPGQFPSVNLGATSNAR